MKKLYAMISVMAIVMIAQAQIPVLDVTKTYPKMSFCIQDIAEVEYVPLGITDEILWLGREVEYVDEDYIIGSNGRMGVLVHDRQGRPLHSFHRLGQGPEEYNSLMGFCFDKQSDEVFINDFMSNKIFVYDLRGNFKRVFPTGFGGINRMKDIKIWSDKELLAYVQDDMWVIISRTDGKKVAEKSLRTDKPLNLMIRGEGGLRANVGMDMLSRRNGEHIISSYAADTIFCLTDDFKFRPIMTKVPEARSMEVPVFMAFAAQTPQYLFVSTIRKEYDFSKNTGFPSVDYIVDKTTNKIYERGSITNNDWQGQEVYLENVSAAMDTDTYIQSLHPSRLIKALEEGKLSGKLKEIAEKLEEDDNPVLMIMKLK